jgi:putative FmdB family regulatory protein
MPIYEFKCEDCDNEFEDLVFSSSPNDVCCPKCEGVNVKRLMSVSSFKSSGNFSSSAGPSCSGCTSSNCGSCH